MVSKKMNKRLLIDLHASYKKNLSGEYQYGGSHPEYISVTELETSDANYLNSDWHRIGGSLTYSQIIKVDAKTNFFVKASYDHVGTSDLNYNKRNHFTLSMCCHF